MRLVGDFYLICKFLEGGTVHFLSPKEVGLKDMETLPVVEILLSLSMSYGQNR